MFCIQHPHHHNRNQDNHHHSRILHSFRSHKTLKAEEQMRHHHRQPSEASSVARSSAESSRPSTRGRDVSVEWDPLRLHPAMASTTAPVFSTIQPRESRRYEPRELRHAQSLHNLHNSQQHNNHNRITSSSSHSPVEPTMVIYEGFDFGFGHHKNIRPPAPPSSSGSESDCEMPATPTSITPRPHPAGMEGPDYFIKRGDWKRRGIVFSTSETAMATEDECFDLDIDML